MARPMRDGSFMRARVGSVAVCLAMTACLDGSQTEVRLVGTLNRARSMYPGIHPRMPDAATPSPPRSFSVAGWVALVMGLALVSGGAVVALLLARFAFPSSATSHVDVTPSPNVVLAVRALARLETVQFHMERVVELTDQQTHLFGVFESRDAILLVAVGDVVAGVDLAKLSPEDVESDGAKRSIRVRIPAPEIFSATLDNARTHVVLRSTDTLATRREDIEGMARREAEARLERAATVAGILTRATENAERGIESLLRSMGYREVEVASKPTSLLPDMPSFPKLNSEEGSLR
jgi:hypothetical protein